MKSKITEKDLEKLTIQNKKNQVKKLTQEQIEENVIEWTTFFRRNLDIFVRDYLEIDIYAFQEQLLLTWSDNDITDTMASRGISKSFLVGLFSICMALLYSNCYILITSFTLNQSNSIIDEKIDKIFTSQGRKGSSPILVQMRKDGYIKFKKDENTGAKIVEFGNGSKIFAVNCGDSARGKRANIVITDECVLVKRKDYQEIIEPTLEKRNFAGRPSDYDSVERPKQIFLSSAKNKGNWMWNHLKTTVVGHYKDKITNYGFFAGDIFTAVANGIQTKQQYLQRRKSTDDMSFQQEYLNIFLGNSESSMFKYEDFEINQVLEEAFYPREPLSIIENKKQSYVFDNKIRILVCDIAVATGNDNDNTVFIFMSIDIETGERKVEYVKTESGLNSVKQVILMKRYFYEYQANYFMLDTKGIGNVIFDLLTVETQDVETYNTYPAWTVCRDKDLQISSDTVINDKLTRTIETDALDIIIPFAGTAELNSQMHLALRKSLRDKLIYFLKDDGEMQAKIEDKDPTFTTKSADYKAEIMLPFVQTRYMINESISLEMKINENGTIKLSEATRTATKDRYMTLGMANFLAEKIINKYNKDNQTGDEINIEDWKWLAT